MREVKPTQKPVPSFDLNDLLFNSGLLDKWATSLEHQYIDRFGNCHLTSAGMEWLYYQLKDRFQVDINQAIAAAGYETVDSFQLGAQLPNNEITQRNQSLRDDITGEYYRWDGDLPKQVQAGSTPQSTGGVGKGAWISVGQNITNYFKLEERLLGAGSSLYKGVNGKYIQNSDVIPVNITHLTTLVNGNPEDIAFAPSATGVVSGLSNTGAKIGTTDVQFYNPRYEIENVLAWKIGNRTDSEAITLARRFSPYRSQITIPKGTWVSDLTTQQIYWGGGEINKSDGKPNFSFIRANSGRTDGTTRELYGVIRQNTQKSGWYFIEDFAHRKNGFKDVISIDANDPYKLILKYDFMSRFVGNVNITVDEWFAKAGVMVGNSVGRDEMFLWAHRAASFTVENQSLNVAANGFFGSTITASKGNDGTITITHPTVLSATDTATISVYRPTEGVIQIPAIVSTTATTIKYAMFSNLAGGISFNNGNWQVETGAYIKPTVSVSAAGITLSHPDLANGLLFVSARSANWGNAEVESQGSSSKIVLRDYNGNIINPMSNPEKYQVYFQSTAMTKQGELKGGVAIHRSNVALKWENLYGESGNIWIGGTMEV
ncbi:hypothetical protein MJ634_002180 [Providencia rettgeri]|uniref:tail fiber/spike domain-containing protein n=2 Tax=Providencia rettgeri TaxID=587 RepID=UPI001D2109DB|nr:hypothetical protein [Providencia rettgeri]EHZ7762319.1 hypothetical protein [Providencia rettgeri]EIJ7165461.1 hypothetical protein [Providencia rettgeri]ELR5102821.1 hypothetical protein [Providencia rettgeri]MCJ2221865.1 hypothetical protein [Providencia rettgeri]